MGTGSTFQRLRGPSQVSHLVVIHQSVGRHRQRPQSIQSRECPAPALGTVGDRAGLQAFARPFSVSCHHRHRVRLSSSFLSKRPIARPCLARLSLETSLCLPPAPNKGGLRRGLLLMVWGSSRPKTLTRKRSQFDHGIGEFEGRGLPRRLEM